MAKTNQKTVVQPELSIVSITPTIERITSKEEYLANLNAVVQTAIDSEHQSASIIQDTLIMLTECAYKYADVSRFQKLVQGVKGSNRKAIMQWASANAPVIFKKTGVLLNKPMYKYGKFDAESLAKVKAWYAFNPSYEDSVSEHDVFKMIQDMVKKLDGYEANPLQESKSKTNEGGEPIMIEHKIVNGGMKQYLKDALTKYQATYLNIDAMI